ncbi:hypothetical protein V8U11_15940 [Pseudomonas chlororaphis]|uniref:hypothetical protein n=1 Tax=Pseudomonas chlororaphis TaxID=587753 RepID=UPI0030CFEC40
MEQKEMFKGAWKALRRVAIAAVALGAIAGSVAGVDVYVRHQDMLRRTANDFHTLNTEYCHFFVSCSSFNYHVGTKNLYKDRATCEAVGREHVKLWIVNNGDSFLSRHVIECRPGITFNSQQWKSLEERVDAIQQGKL